MAPAAALSSLWLAFTRLWRQVKWVPTHKEVFWRLDVDGVPKPGSSLHLPGVPWGTCAYGAVESDASPRLDHFWACPIYIRRVACRGRAPVPDAAVRHLVGGLARCGSGGCWVCVGCMWWPWQCSTDNSQPPPISNGSQPPKTSMHLYCILLRSDL